METNLTFSKLWAAYGEMGGNGWRKNKLKTLEVK